METDRQADRQTDNDLYAQHNEALFAAGFTVELSHFFDGEVTADVGVNDKEASWIPSEDLVTKVVQSPGSAQGAVLLEVPVWEGRENKRQTNLSQRTLHSC